MQKDWHVCLPHVPVLVKPFRRTEVLAKIDCLADEIREAEQSDRNSRREEH